MKSLAIRPPAKKVSLPRADQPTISGSLPITMNRAKPLPSMSSVFGTKHDMVSKSWSDLWDEEIEEEEHEQEIKARQALNSRTWSHESTTEAIDIIQRQGLSEPKGSSFVNMRSMSPAADIPDNNDIDGDIVDDGFFFFQDSAPLHQASPPRYSPPSKRTTFDKWAALGDRRRAATTSSEKSPDIWRGRHNTMESGKVTPTSITNTSKGFGTGVWEFGKMNSSNVNTSSHNIGRAKGCPWARDRDYVHEKQHIRKEKSSDLGDLEWVGGWQDSLDLQL